MKIVKQVVGIDVSKDTFYACLGSINEQQQIRLVQQASFCNNEKGFSQFYSWVVKHLPDDLAIWYVMEATGVYYENLAYFLSAKTENICVLMPTKAKYFAKSLAIKSKTDKTDAAMLCRIGLERLLPVWKLPTPCLKQLKALCREYRVLKSNAAKIKVREHALSHSHEPEKRTIRRLKQQMKLMTAQIREVEQEIKELIKNDEYLYRQFKNIEQIKGVSTITIATIVSETNGFASITNIKQLTSYAGMDVMINQSGLFNGKTRISKKGNSHIRAALYPPAMSALQCNQRLKQFYQAVMTRHTCGKIGVVAVARKMLILIYTLWKKEVNYDPLKNVA